MCDHVCVCEYIHIYVCVRIFMYTYVCANMRVCLCVCDTQVQLALLNGLELGKDFVRGRHGKPLFPLCTHVDDLHVPRPYQMLDDDYLLSIMESTGHERRLQLEIASKATMPAYNTHTHTQQRSRGFIGIGGGHAAADHFRAHWRGQVDRLHEEYEEDDEDADSEGTSIDESDEHDEDEDAEELSNQVSDRLFGLDERTGGINNSYAYPPVDVDSSAEDESEIGLNDAPLQSAVVSNTLTQQQESSHTHTHTHTHTQTATQEKSCVSPREYAHTFEERVKSPTISGNVPTHTHTHEQAKAHQEDSTVEKNTYTHAQNEIFGTHDEQPTASAAGGVIGVDVAGKNALEAPAQTHTHTHTHEHPGITGDTDMSVDPYTNDTDIDMGASRASNSSTNELVHPRQLDPFEKMNTRIAKRHHKEQESRLRLEGKSANCWGYYFDEAIRALYLDTDHQQREQTLRWVAELFKLRDASGVPVGATKSLRRRLLAAQRKRLELNPFGTITGLVTHIYMDVYICVFACVCLRKHL